MMENRLITTARRALRRRGRILFPEDATVFYPAFDPCKSTQVVARVTMPAIIGMKETVLTYCVMDGDAV